MKKIGLIILMISALMLTACTNQKTEDNNGKIKVYTSFYAMYDFAKMIGGDNISLENLIPTGVEPHDWEPSASDMVKLENADVFIYSGAGMESWTDRVLESVSSPKLIAVETSKEIDIHDHAEDEHDTHSHNDHDNGTHHHNGDPHVWLNPDNAIMQMQAIEKALSLADPDNAPSYQERLAQAERKMEELKNRYAQGLASLSKHKIIVSHEAYGYLTMPYGLEQIGLEGFFADGEPTPSKMAEIVAIAKAENIQYIFADNLGSDKVVQALAKEIGGEVLVLNPFEGDTQNRDYFEVMEENLSALIKALQ